MDQLLKIFNAGYFGSALGVVGLVVAGITFYASRKRKILVYSYKRRVIIKGFKNNIDGLDIKYEGKPIKNLSSTNIGIWNKGRDPIRRSDVAPKDKITIHFKDKIIGNPEILFTKTPSSQVSISKSGNDIIIDFDFLDFEDGVVIQVFHTWDMSSMKLETDEDTASDSFFITGKIIGSREKIRLEKIVNHLTWLPLYNMLFMASLIAFCSLVYRVFNLQEKLVSAEESPLKFLTYIVLSVLLMTIFLGGLSYLAELIVGKQRKERRLNPKVIDRIY